MSEEDYSFATFMQSVPTYKYLKILEHVVFDQDIANTPNDDWNYYGEYIREWYPALLDLLRLSDIEIDEGNKKLALVEAVDEVESADFLPHQFYDPFLDYIRKEINESYNANLYLSVMFLTRKVLESIYIRIAEVVFPKIQNGNYNAENHAIWYDIDHGIYQGFGRLIDAFDENATEFQEDKRLIRALCERIRPLKKELNVCIHADYEIPDAQYVRKWKIPRIVNLARRMFRKYCNP